jgi:hypothetical protein
MHLYNARVEVAQDEPSSEVREHVSAALEHFEPKVGASGCGQLEVWVTLTAENLMQATITAVSVVWTAVGAEPVAVDVHRSLMGV